MWTERRHSTAIPQIWCEYYFFKRGFLEWNIFYITSKAPIFEGQGRIQNIFRGSPINRRFSTWPLTGPLQREDLLLVSKRHFSRTLLELPQIEELWRFFFSYKAESNILVFIHKVFFKSEIGIHIPKKKTPSSGLSMVSCSLQLQILMHMTFSRPYIDTRFFKRISTGHMLTSKSEDKWPLGQKTPPFRRSSSCLSQPKDFVSAIQRQNFLHRFFFLEIRSSTISP